MKEATTLSEPHITASTKVRIGLIGAIVATVVWISSYVMPIEARVNKHDEEISGANSKLDKLLEKVGNIEGKLEYLPRGRR
jgi:hypothetical protein